jgi:hypothetical protein
MPVIVRPPESLGADDAAFLPVLPYSVDEDLGFKSKIQNGGGGAGACHAAHAASLKILFFMEQEVLRIAA